MIMVINRLEQGKKCVSLAVYFAKVLIFIFKRLVFLRLLSPLTNIIVSLQRLFLYRKPRWAEVGQTYISVMAFLNALVLTNWNLANSSTSQGQSSKERLMRCIISRPYWLQTIFRLLLRGCIYTLTWGFCVARFDLSGNARASIRGTGNCTAPRFLFHNSRNHVDVFNVIAIYTIW